MLYNAPIALGFWGFVGFLVKVIVTPIVYPAIKVAEIGVKVVKAVIKLIPVPTIFNLLGDAISGKLKQDLVDWMGSHFSGFTKWLVVTLTSFAYDTFKTFVTGGLTASIPGLIALVGGEVAVDIGMGLSTLVFKKLFPNITNEVQKEINDVMHVFGPLAPVLKYAAKKVMAKYLPIKLKVDVKTLKKNVTTLALGPIMKIYPKSFKSKFEFIDYYNKHVITEDAKIILKKYL